MIVERLQRIESLELGSWPRVDVQEAQELCSHSVAGRLLAVVLGICCGCHFWGEGRMWWDQVWMGESGRSWRASEGTRAASLSQCTNALTKYVPGSRA